MQTGPPLRRTRKWAFVGQEATRLAALGLAPKAIAARLGVSWSTVSRWIAAGKLAVGRPRHVLTFTSPAPSALQSPSEWARSVREEFQFDATDDQLVAVAEVALTISRDPQSPAPVRMTAMGRFQAIARQLR